MSASVKYENFRLHPPGSRKGNKFWVMRANLGRQVEISTWCADQTAAAVVARQIIREWHEQERRDQLASIAGVKSFVYFIRNPLGSVKIGVSTDPHARLRDLQTGCSVPLELYGVMPGEEADERAIHRLFAGCRIQGEWFRLVPRIERFIRENCVRELGETLGRRPTPKLYVVENTA